MGQIGLLFLSGAIAGMIGGLTGIGGGVILVPMLSGPLKVPQHEAHATSLAIIIPLAASGTVLYAYLGHLNWLLVGELALGSIVGVVIGARLMHRVPAKTLRRIFGGFLLVVGLCLVTRGAIL